MDVTTQELINWLEKQGASLTIVSYGPKNFSGFQEGSAFKAVNPRLGGEGILVPIGPGEGGQQIIPERQAREWCRSLGYKAPPELDVAEPAGGNNRLQELESFLAGFSDIRTKLVERGKTLIVERNGKNVALNRQALNYLNVIKCCNELNIPYPQSIAATEQETIDTETVVDAITAANGNRVFRSVAAADGSYTLKSTDRQGGTRTATVRPDPAGRPMKASDAVLLCRDLDVDPPAVIPNNLRRNDLDSPRGARMPGALSALVNRQQQVVETADRAAAAAAGKPSDPDADPRPLLMRIVNDNNAERGVNARGERVRETAEEIHKERGERSFYFYGSCRLGCPHLPPPFPGRRELVALPAPLHSDDGFKPLSGFGLGAIRAVAGMQFKDDGCKAINLELSLKLEPLTAKQLLQPASAHP